MLNLVLPKGSLEAATLELFEAADLSVSRSSSVDYRASIDDPRIDDVRILRPQEIPRYVAEGLFDLGITGRDWIEETGAEVVSLGSPTTPRRAPVPSGWWSPWTATPRSRRSRICRGACECRPSTRRGRAGSSRSGIDADIRLSYGATEAKVPDIVDCIVEITETGRALRAAGLKVIDTILTSYTELIANPIAYQDPEKAHAMGQVHTLLAGSLEARGKVLVKLNVAAEQLEEVVGILPSMKDPTVNQLHHGGYAVESVVPKSEINTLIPKLKDHGATDIIEIPLAKIVHRRRSERFPFVVGCRTTTRRNRHGTEHAAHLQRPGVVGDPERGGPGRHQRRVRHLHAEDGRGRGVPGR